MGEDLYEVYAGQTIIATGMTLEVTMILVEALINKWYQEPAFVIAIRKVEGTET